MNKIQLTVDQARTINTILQGKRDVMIFAVAQPVYERMADIIQALSKDLTMADIEVIADSNESLG